MWKLKEKRLKGCTQVSSLGNRKSGVVTPRMGDGREWSGQKCEERHLGQVVIEILGRFQEGSEKCESEFRDKA